MVQFQSYAFRYTFELYQLKVFQLMYPYSLEKLGNVLELDSE